MKGFKVIFLGILSILMSFLISTNVYSMSRPEYPSMPAYPIYPNEETLIDVSSLDINIMMNKDEDRTSTIKYHYTLQNTSDAATTLKFFLPLYESYQNVEVIVDNQILDKDSLSVLKFGIEYDDIDYQDEASDYQELLKLMAYKDKEDLFEYKTVNLYEIPKTNKSVHYEVIYNSSSSIIATNLPRRDDGTVGCQCILTETNYIIDFNKDIDVFIEQEEVAPVLDVPFKDAMKTLIQASTSETLSDETLDQYYNIYVELKSFSSGVIELDYLDQNITEYYQYEITFLPKEIKYLTLTLKHTPSYYLTRTDPYYIYQLYILRDYWHRFNEDEFQVVLTYDYPYIQESNIDLLEVETHVYQGELDESMTKITFGLFNEDKVPEMSGSAWEAVGFVFKVLLIIGLIISIFVSIFLFILFIIFIRYLIKRHRKYK